jgi:hypothetical protein
MVEPHIPVAALVPLERRSEASWQRVLADHEQQQQPRSSVGKRAGEDAGALEVLVKDLLYQEILLFSQHRNLHLQVRLYPLLDE